MAEVFLLVPRKQQGRQHDYNGKGNQESYEHAESFLLAALKEVLLSRKVLMGCLCLELYEFSAQNPFD